jgi:class 3 adenylate cyclase
MTDATVQSDDLVLLRKAIAVEIEKRAAILTADGRGLQQKTRESEELVRQMRRIQGPLSSQVREAAERLQTESNENLRLLDNANRTLHGLITDLGEKEATYAPSQSNQKKSGGYLLDATV